MKKNAIIYGITIGDTIHYIGKTHRVNEKGDIKRSNITHTYRNLKIKKILTKPDVEIIPIKTVPLKDWYDDKLKEVVEKYQKDHPLLNAQWMKEGKRGYWSGTHGSFEEGGYWSGKTRDAHTIKRLCESKFKLIAQYDPEGNLMKIWGSGKEIAKKVFKDYRVENGSAKSLIYGITKAGTLKGRFKLDSYWFKYEDLIEKFNDVPQKLDIQSMREEELKFKRENRKKVLKINRTHKRRYTILHFKDDVQFIKYDNIFHAGYELRTSPNTVRRICNGNYRFNPLYDLRYGEKELQRIDLKKQYSRYKIKKLKKLPKVKQPRQCTRTRYSVEHVIDNVVVQNFKDTHDAAYQMGLPERRIRLICSGKYYYNERMYPTLRYGKKITINL